MTEPNFDHEKLGVYRLSIEYVAASYGISERLAGVNRHTRDQWLRAAHAIPHNIAEGNGKQSLQDKNRYFEIARGSAVECAAIHDMLMAFAAIDEESKRQGKSRWKRIVSMLTRLIQRPHTVAGDAIENGKENRFSSPSQATHHTSRGLARASDGIRVACSDIGSQCRPKRPTGYLTSAGK